MAMERHEAEARLAELAFDEEQRKLAGVVAWLEAERIRLKAKMPATADDQRAADEIQEILIKQSESFWQAIEQPYFGRLDYFHRRDGDPVPGDGNSEDDSARMRTIYLGGTYIPNEDVFNWTAPVGRLWYTQSRDDGYTAPRGYIATRVDLKRYLRIRDGELEDLNDIFKHQLSDAPDGRLELLAETLSGSGAEDGHLTVIIETIEPEQYETIANVSDKVLIVQGVAGSGKSEIGLHRIAFLLSPFSEIGASERPTPETTLLVGPSQVFLDNADNVLPGLGVADGVHRTRFSEWLRDNLSLRQVQFRPRILNDLQQYGEMRGYDEGAESFKASLYMADALERRVSELATQIRRRVNGLGPLLGPDGNVRVTALQAKDALAAALPRGGRPFLNRQREEFIRMICEIVERDSPAIRRAQRQRRNELDRLREMGRARSDIRRAVVEWCGATWPSIDFRSEYGALLSDRERMIRLAGRDGGKDRLDAETARALAESASRNTPNVFGDSDAGALAYLDHLLNQTVESKYKHVVVDEAQDISPIEFKLLSLSSENNWFTILGDTAQRLTPYRGIESWRDVERVFGRADVKIQRAPISYRSTKRITTFTNRILRTYYRGDYTPKPFDRDGERVEYSRHANVNAMHLAIAEEIGRIRAEDSETGRSPYTIAILARAPRNLNAFEAFCAESEIGERMARIGKDGDDGARTILARIPEVKGLEYDAVIVMGVNDSFRDTLFNKKLLYMATTRARHRLSLHWAGKRSPILDSVSEQAVNWRQR